MSKNILNEALLKLARDWPRAAFGERDDSSLRVELTCLSQGWGLPKHGKSIVNGPLCLGDKVFSSGIGTHADSEIVLKLPSLGKRLCAVVGMDRNLISLKHHSRKERIVFSVEVGGKELFACKPLGLDSPPLEVKIDLNGAREITLKTRDIGGSIKFAHADWADIQIELEDGAIVTVGMPQNLPKGGIPPISFRMSGQPSSEVLERSSYLMEILPSGDGFSQKKVAWHDPIYGLEVVVEATEFAGFPAVEYVLRLKNNGKVNTPIIEDILSADFSWPAAATTVLYRSRGSAAIVEDFLYSKEDLAPGTNLRMTTTSGRSSHMWLPFFNVETGKNGLVMAIGWTGTWLAEFNRLDEDVLKIRAGMERTRLTLHPGEEIRMPRILLIFWEGEPLNGHNLLRRFLVRHGTPRPGGRQPITPVAFAAWGGSPTTAHIGRIAQLEAEHAGCDCYWIDAGWYGPKGTSCESVWSPGWYKCAGHWSVNPSAHPDGLRPIGDAARKAGMKFLLWLDPEHAIAGTPWPKEHPEWFLGIPSDGASLLLNLGIPEARRFVTNYVSDLITREGVDIYRQDFNIGNPHLLWQAADAPDRIGMTEIRHIEGLYAFWDDLLRRHPNLLIDNCAGGGRRIDIETIRRSIPLWRSDYQCYPEFDATGSQIQGIGLNYWIPFSAMGTFIRPNDTYDFRSALAAGIALTPLINDANNMPKDYPWPWLRNMIAQLKRCRPAFAGDFYPFISCSAVMDNWTEMSLRAASPGSGSDHYRAAKDIWVAYQMHRDDLNEGFLVVFRRDQSPFISAQLALKGLDGNKRYMVEDADTGEKQEIAGAALLSKGLLVQIPNPRESRLFFLRAL